MFIYNVTVKVDWSIHEAWVQWMLNEHMPEMIKPVVLLMQSCFAY